MAQIRIPAKCTNPDCGDRLPVAKRPTPDERQRGIRRGREYRLTRTWVVVPRETHTDSGVTLTILDRQLICQSCRHKGSLGKPNKADGEISASEVGHL